jgi:hypothetical protein
MDRRAALKNISLSFGYTIATPTLLGMLQSCTSDVTTWSPVFFSKTEGHIITQLADIILPASEIAGALDVNVPEFMDKMYNEIVREDEKSIMKEGATAFSNEYSKIYGKDASKGSKDEFEKLLETYFKIPENQQNEISTILKEEKSSLNGTKLNTFLIYKFLTETRRYTLYGYYTSEHVGENILSYDPIPGGYEACIPVEDIGNAWSL